MKVEAIAASVANLSFSSAKLSSLGVRATAFRYSSSRVVDQGELECVQCWKFVLLGKFPLKCTVADRRILSQKHSSLIDWKRCYRIPATRHWPCFPNHATSITCNLTTACSCFIASNSGTRSNNGISSSCSRYNKSASSRLSRGYVSASNGLAEARICWNCGNQVTAMFMCSVCGKILEPPPFVSYNDNNSESEFTSITATTPKTAQNLNHAHNPRLTYFHIFQVESKFDVDLRKVKQQYRYIQASMHPDKFSGACEKEQEYSHQISSLVNHALKTLQSPYSRGKYLLKIKGHTTPAHSGENMHSLDANSQDFLQFILEWNEIVEDTASDDAESLQLLREKLSNERQSLLENISKYFEIDELYKADDCLAQLKYLDNISEKLKFNFD